MYQPIPTLSQFHSKQQNKSIKQSEYTIQHAILLKIYFDYLILCDFFSNQEKSIMSKLENYINQNLKEAYNLLNEFILNNKNIELIEAASRLIADTFENNRKVIIAGNGGSAADAIHFAEEFTGRYKKNRRALPVISLTDGAFLTCVGNDFGFEEIFSRGVEAFGQQGDCVILISTSGNSENIIRALSEAKKRNLKTIGFIGKSGGKLKSSFDIEFHINHNDTARIQELHMMILHIIIETAERILFPENYMESSDV